MLALFLLLIVGWWWFLGLLFVWGDSLAGVAYSVAGLSGFAWLLLGWRAGILLASACLTGLGQGLLFQQSSACQQWLFHSKLGQVRRGRLVYVPQWGWVDQRHRLEELWEPLAPGRAQPFEHLFFGSWGRFYYLQIQCQPRCLEDSASALQQIGERCEAEEQRLPWYLAAHLSAYNADDLPSVYWTIFRRFHPQVAWSEYDPASSEQLWRAEGRIWVQRRLHGWRDFEPLQAELRRPYRELFEKLESHPLPVTFSLRQEP